MEKGVEKALTRNSNFELLRLLAMFSIVVYHQFLFLKGLYPETTWVVGGYTISHFGVPIFLLITGYFGLKLKRKKLIHLYLYCCLWWILTYLLGCTIYNTTVWGGSFGNVYNLLLSQQVNGFCCHI